MRASFPGKGPLRRVLPALVLVVAVAGCGGSGEGGDGASGATSTTVASTGSTTSTTRPVGGTSSSTSSSAPSNGFEGRTTPTSAPAPASTTGVALLTDVRVAAQSGFDRVVFEFADDQAPGYDIAYLDGPALQDGSGDEIAVAGGARLEVRMAGASGVDLQGETLDETYTGPDRVEGDTEVVTEVVRTGDFEANLTWVVGVDERVPYRVEVLANPARIVIDLATG